MFADDEDVALAQGAVLDQHSGNRTPAHVELGFDHRPACRPVRVGPQFQKFGLKRDRFQQVIKPEPGLRRNLDVLHFAGHGFHNDFMLQKVGADLLRVRLVLVDLVDRHDHRHLGGLGVVDRLDRLRHHGVICCDHQHHDVRHLGPARAHGGEGRVAGRVEEGDQLAIGRLHLVGADMLGDAARFARDDTGLADRVQKRGLAVVDMAHDRDDRRARCQVVVRVLDRVDDLLDVGIRHTHRLVAEFLDHQFGGVGVDGLVHRDHHAHLHQGLDHIGGPFGHTVGKFRDDDGFRQLHVAHLLFGLVAQTQRLLAGLFLLALDRGKAALATALIRDGV